MTDPRTSYRLAAALAVATLVLLVLGAGALGIIGAGGRPDLMYLAVPAVALVGTAAARLRPRAMSRAMTATAATPVVVALVALAAGLHREDGASAVDIVGISAMYGVLFAVSAWLFHRSAESSAARGDRAAA